MEKHTRTILVVDDNEVNRKILCHILQTEYDTVQAENGKEALDILNDSGDSVSAVLLDLIMPVMDGYAFLQALKQTGNTNLPVIVTTGSGEKENQRQAFQLGAWDFVQKPYDADILKYRLQSAIARSESASYERLRYLTEHDELTGIYQRGKFFRETERMLHRNPATSFVFARLDVDRFSLINAFFGMTEGDALLKHIGAQVALLCQSFAHATYGRMEGDEFALCVSYTDLAQVEERLRQFGEELKHYPLEFQIVLTFGLYVVSDHSSSAALMLDHAKLAAKQAKGHYSGNLAYYDEEMGRQLVAEQEILNDMQQALEQEQFQVYFQPKYDLHTDLPDGAEALVRWNHPQKGVISPAVFIPVFERNGFVVKLDYYVWEKVCAYLEQWNARGLPPHAISVNVSRVHLYHPQLVEILCRVTDRHQVPHDLLHLEITESIYTESPAIIQENITKLHERGFKVLMDDFGSGYSSLNVLKDADFDILKIDMRFFEQSTIQGRGESIIASVIRMAKWLDLPTIAEGVEKEEQVTFLRDMGCEYVQGFYFARPMPAEEYEALLCAAADARGKQGTYLAANGVWSDDAQIELLFSTASYPVVLYEYRPGNISVLRANKAFYDLFGYEDPAVITRALDGMRAEAYSNPVWEAFSRRWKAAIPPNAIICADAGTGSSAGSIWSCATWSRRARGIFCWAFWETSPARWPWTGRSGTSRICKMGWSLIGRPC